MIESILNNLSQFTLVASGNIEFTPNDPILMVELCLYNPFDSSYGRLDPCTVISRISFNSVKPIKFVVLKNVDDSIFGIAIERDVNADDGIFLYTYLYHDNAEYTFVGNIQNYIFDNQILLQLPFVDASSTLKYELYN